MQTMINAKKKKSWVGRLQNSRLWRKVIWSCHLPQSKIYCLGSPLFRTAARLAKDVRKAEKEI